jgi:phenol 2-monooxygenase (NADPH)
LEEKIGGADASDIAVNYGASVVVAKEGDSTKQGDGTDVMGKEALRVVTKQDLAKDVKVGMRMPSFKVLNQADARPWHFQELLKSRGLLAVGNLCGQHEEFTTEGENREVG